VIEHGARAASLDHRAMEQLERGHVGRAIALEDRARDQRVEMVGAAIHPHHHHHHYYPPPPPVGVVVAAEAAMVAGAVVKGAVVGAEVAAIHRQRDIREAELIAAASNPYRGGYGPVYVELCQELIHPTLGAPTIHPGEPTRLLPTLLLAIPLLAIRLQGTHPLDIRLDILTSFILS